MPSVASALNGGKASDWSRPFPYQWEGSKLPEGQYQSAMDTLMEYTWLSISPAFPRVRGKPYHVSSQGKEAVFVTHDIDILPIHESCASVHGFSVTNCNYCTNNLTYQNNCYSLFICTSDH